MSFNVTTIMQRDWVRKNTKIVLLFLFLLAGCFGSWKGISFLNKKRLESLPQVPQCKKLRKIPLGNETGLVTSVKNIQINGIEAPYNAAIVEKGDGNYLLFYRYDVKEPIQYYKRILPFKTRIGCAVLDQNFNELSNNPQINTGSDFSEDPRVAKIGNDYCLMYNDLVDNPANNRTMRIAFLDSETLEVKHKTSFNLNLQPVEKNWMLFEQLNEEGKVSLNIIYSVHPHKVFSVTDPLTGTMESSTVLNQVACQALPWNTTKWGVIRGGSAARLIDGQYLAFFHSAFKDKEKKRNYYVMGAYTFEPKFPFRITAMSSVPIVFKGLYDTKAINTAGKHLRCAFPNGFAVSQKEGRDYIHLSFGENDCATKIVTFDKEALYQTLQKIPEPLSTRSSAQTFTD